MLKPSTMLDVSAAILDNGFKTSTPSLILLSMKRCESFCHSVTIARFSSSTVLNMSLVVDSLLKSTSNSVIHGPINISAIWRPHVRFNEVYVLFFR